MNPLLNIALKAAREAGKTLLRHAERLERVAVEVKGPGDFVSAVDRMAEDDIVDAIRARYPRHRIIAEERGVIEGEGENAAGDGEEKDGKSGRKKDARAGKPDDTEWLIDPLDGTTNYLHGHPHFAVSIAVKQRGQVQHAVVYDPLRDEMFTASRGQGAYLNRRRLRVTKQRRLRRALLATGVNYHGSRARFEAWRRCFDALIPRAIDIRRSGSAALDLAYIAAGRLDGYWQANLGAWDMAAGALLVREAGGLVADFGGGQGFLESGEIIASNPFVFNDLLVTVSKAVEVGESVESADSAPAAAATKIAANTAAIATADAKPRAKITAKPAKKSAKKVAKKRAKSGPKPDRKPAKTAAKSGPKPGPKPDRKPARFGAKHDRKPANPRAKTAAKKRPTSRAKPRAKTP